MGAGDFRGGGLEAQKFTTKPTKLSRRGDLILAVRASIGDKVEADGVYCLGRGVAALRPKPGLDVRYLWHWLDAVRPALQARARGILRKRSLRRRTAAIKVSCIHPANYRCIEDVELKLGQVNVIVGHNTPAPN